MADGAEIEPYKDPAAAKWASLSENQVAITAAGLYGRGYQRRQIARILLDHLVTTQTDRPEEQLLSQARAKLKRWERSETFRNMVYDRAVVELDMSTPKILQGVARKAKSGRVDAARLALELTGRHNPQGQQQPTQVAVIFQGIPRPGQEDDTVVEAEAVEADGD